MIELKNIIKNYKIGEVETKVLKGINIKIKESEFVAIMGPSGSGKSTLMNIIGMLDMPTSGQYIFNNKDVSKLSDNELAEIRLKSIGFVFQNFNLLKRTTVLKNVTLPFIYMGQPRSIEEREKIAGKALEDVGLEDKKIWSHLSNQLSGGQMQRVAIARALVNDPKLLLADEPTGNLDSRTGEIVMTTFIKLNKEQRKSIILITHEQEVAEFADRIIIIKDGEIIKDYKNKQKKISSEGLKL
jgi:putative ABC transport system ATP-binding protein